MNHKIRKMCVAVTVTVALLVILGINNMPAHAGQIDSDGDGIPDVAEQILGTNPKNSDTDGDGINDLKDKTPVFAENPIVNTATRKGFEIVDALVENNYDPRAKKDANDHLEITLKNISGTDLTDFETYYTIKDADTKKREGYYVKIPNLVVKSGESVTIHFDNATGLNHFGENENSIYHTGKNAKIFELTMSVPGYAPVTIQIKKDAGGVEQAD